eukprot:2120688-Pyramimonas_sp.AAC.1
MVKSQVNVEVSFAHNIRTVSGETPAQGVRGAKHERIVPSLIGQLLHILVDGPPDPAKRPVATP